MERFDWSEIWKYGTKERYCSTLPSRYASLLGTVEKNLKTGRKLNGDGKHDKSLENFRQVHKGRLFFIKLSFSSRPIAWEYRYYTFPGRLERPDFRFVLYIFYQ